MKEKLWKHGHNNANTSWRACLLASQRIITSPKPHLIKCPPQPQIPRVAGCQPPLKPLLSLPSPGVQVSHSLTCWWIRWPMCVWWQRGGDWAPRPENSGEPSREKPGAGAAHRDDSSTHWSPSWHSQAGHNGMLIIHRYDLRYLHRKGLTGICLRSGHWYNGLHRGAQ